MEYNEAINIDACKIPLLKVTLHQQLKQAIIGET